MTTAYSDTRALTIPHHWYRTVLALLLAVCFLPAAVSAQERVTEILVTGRQPGPPLWRVSNGDNVLWILPTVSAVPRDMIWDTTRLERVLSESQELILPPDIGLDISKLVLLNPVNWVRAYRLVKRIGRHPDGDTLQASLPPDLYARYAAIQQQYFPREKDYEKQRPAFVAGSMMQRVLEEEKLDGASEVGKQMQRLTRKHKQLKRTSVEVQERVEGSFGDLRDRAENWVDSLTFEQEVQCFAEQVDRIERHVSDMKEVANAWATGDAADLEEYLRRGDSSDPCYALMLASSEGAFMQRLLDESGQLWVAAAEQALQNNLSSVAVLNLNQIIGSNSLVDALVAKGYVLHSPR